MPDTNEGKMNMKDILTFKPKTLFFTLGQVRMMSILTIMFIMSSLSLCAQSHLIGTWQSKEMKEGTETVIMELTFKDSTNLEMAFVTDNKIPNVGRCLSKISVLGTYNFIGPMFFSEIKKETLNVKIVKMELYGELAKKASQDMKSKLKGYLKKEIERSAVPLFSAYDGGSMIYVTHEGTDDVISFIMGDENNAVDMDFTRKKSRE